ASSSICSCNGRGVVIFGNSAVNERGDELSGTQPSQPSSSSARHPLPEADGRYADRSTFPVAESKKALLEPIQSATDVTPPRNVKTAWWSSGGGVGAFSDVTPTASASNARISRRACRQRSLGRVPSASASQQAVLGKTP